MPVTHVELVPRSIDRWRDVLPADRWEGLHETMRLGRAMLAGRAVWHVNSTATGGGVAEMLAAVLSYFHGAGFDTRWAVIGGRPDFFAITKRLHNAVHGSPGDGGELGWQERNAYHRTMGDNVGELTTMIAPGSVVFCHDPQTAGLVEPLRRHGCAVVWRCHIGADADNEYTAAAWAFLEPFVSDADRLVFSRAEHVPAALAAAPVSISSPSIDPFSAKNQRLTPEQVTAILAAAGLVRGGDTTAAPAFYRMSGQTSRVGCRALLHGGSAGLTPGRPLVLQVGRWDRLKDHLGVMRGFVTTLTDSDAELALVGPQAGAVTDDPEGAGVLEELTAEHAALTDAQRARVHLVSLPVDDVEENAAVVNALQRAAAVVVQKSLEEGFGLTVTEALHKARPVIASAVGGIRDQIRHGETGVLLDDPDDPDAFGDALLALLADPQRSGKLGEAGQADVHERYLSDRHIRRWLQLTASLLEVR